MRVRGVASRAGARRRTHHAVAARASKTRSATQIILGGCPSEVRPRPYRMDGESAHTGLTLGCMDRVFDPRAAQRRRARAESQSRAHGPVEAAEHECARGAAYRGRRSAADGRRSGWEPAEPLTGLCALRRVEPAPRRCGPDKNAYVEPAIWTIELGAEPLPVSADATEWVCVAARWRLRRSLPRAPERGGRAPQRGGRMIRRSP